MTKLLLLSFTLFATTSAFAISDAKLAEICLEAGKQKLADQIEAFNCIPSGEVLVESIDNRFYNPSKYVWYTQDAECQDDKTQIIKLVQYNSIKKKCL